MCLRIINGIQKIAPHLPPSTMALYPAWWLVTHVCSMLLLYVIYIQLVIAAGFPKFF